MAELDFSIFSFAKLEKDELHDLLKHQEVEKSKYFIYVNGEKKTTRSVNPMKEVKEIAARSKSRILILDDKLLTLNNELVKGLLDPDTSTRDNTLLIIVGNDPCEEQNEMPYKTKYISSYDKIGKMIRLFFELRKFKQLKDSEKKANDTAAEPNMVIHTSAESTSSIIPPDMEGKNKKPVPPPKKSEESIDKKKKPASLLKKLVENARLVVKCGVLAVICAVLFYMIPTSYLLKLTYMLYPPNQPPATTDLSEISIVDQFTSRIKELKSEMVKQDEKLWRVVRSMKHHINDSNPRQPAVLMLVSTKKASERRENLAREIAEAYSARCSNADYVMVNGAEYTNMDDNDVKLKVDEKILEKFSAGSCAAIISNFEKFPPASTIIFYQFCENNNAQYKDVIVIFTLEVEDGPWDVDDYILAGEESTPNSKKWNEIVDQYLHYSLKTRDKTGTMNADMISLVLSRIPPALAWVSSK